jgi:hypothetical protein
VCVFLCVYVWGGGSTPKEGMSNTPIIQPISDSHVGMQATSCESYKYTHLYRSHATQNDIEKRVSCTIHAGASRVIVSIKTNSA